MKADVSVIHGPGEVQGLPFSSAVRVGDLLFLSGQIGNVPGTRQLADGGIAGQTNVRPSKDRLGCWSKAAELSGAPGFSGVDHGSFALRRVDTQRSERPRPPAGAPRWNQISFPSVRTVGAASLAAGWLSSVRNTAGPAVSPSRVTDA